MWQRIGAIATALAITAMLVASYLVYTPDSGVDVRTLAGRRPIAVSVSLNKPGRAERVASGRTDAEGRLRFGVEPGRYLLRAQRRARGRSPTRRNIAVVVRDDRHSRVVIRYR
jgi:hypothetical protein